jgi:hypothetical protein
VPKQNQVIAIEKGAKENARKATVQVRILPP